MTSTPLLNITEVAAGQNQKEVTINDGFVVIENATNASLPISMAAGTVTLSASQFADGFNFVLSGQTAAAELVVPATERFFAITNKGTAFPVTVTTGGTAGLAGTVAAGALSMVVSDGTNVVASNLGSVPTSEWNAGTVSAIGSGLTLASGGTLELNGTLNNEWNAGTVNAVVGGTVSGGTLTITGGGTGGVSEWNAGTVNAVVGGTVSGGTLTITGGGTGGVSEWMAGTISALGAGLSSSAPSARYWRLYITSTGNGGGYANLSGLKMASTPGGANLLGSGTPSASATTYGSLAGAMSAGDRWQGDATVPSWFEYDFGAGNAYSIAEVTITGNTAAPTNSPGTWSLQYSLDGTTWNTLATFTSAAWTAGGTQTFDVPLTTLSAEWSAGNVTGFTGATLSDGTLAVLGEWQAGTVVAISGGLALSGGLLIGTGGGSSATSHRYWRLYFATGTSSIIGLAEVQMAIEVGGTDVCGSGTASATSTYPDSSRVASAAFDNNLGTGWLSNGFPAALEYDFGAGNAYNIVELRIYPLTWAPTTFLVQVSDDGTTWTTLETLVANGSSGSWQTFDFSASGLFGWSASGVGSISDLFAVNSGTLDVATALRSVPLAFNFSGKLGAGQLLHMPLISDVPLTLPANLAGSAVYVGTYPTSAESIVLSAVNGGSVTTIGTISISTAGSVSLSSTAYTSATGDVLRLTAPATQDATLADVGITIEAHRP